MFFRFIILMIVVCLLKVYHVVEVVLPRVSVVYLLLSFVPIIRSVYVFSFVCYCKLSSCLSVSLKPAFFSFYTNIQFSLNHFPFFENSCMGLSTPVWHCLVHCLCWSIVILSLKLLFIRFVIALSYFFIDSNCLSYLVFCNCNSAHTFFFLSSFSLFCFLLGFLNRYNLVKTFEEYMDFLLKVEIVKFFQSFDEMMSPN